MSGNLRVLLEQLESLGNRISQAGKDFGTASVDNAKRGHETESDPKTFGKDKIGLAMNNPNQYKDGTATEMGTAGQEVGKVISDIGTYMVQAAGELRSGEQDNEKQHGSK
ncbi:hypothetical protein GCM10022247_39980 [Allokutzneria multivorans]|uniref:Uncharacterized protein n=1 Tax=Allokutzneria multivorans TaxID=1142134 RepID=A0ABP7SLS0_9PSEU